MGLIDDANRLQKDLDAKKQEAVQSEVALEGYKLRNELDQAKAEQTKLAHINDEINKLTTQLQDKQSKVAQAERELQKLQHDLNNSQQILNTMRSREGTVLSEIDHMTTSIRTLQSNLGGGGSIF